MELKPLTATRPPSSIFNTCGGRGVPDIGDSLSRQLARRLLQLLDVVRSRRWRAFEAIALSSPRVLGAICDALPNVDELKGRGTLLHAVLRHDPPLETVARMLALLPDPARTEALRTQDGGGRTPLHVAAACDADPRVIKLLGSSDPATCTMLDGDARTPLHLACDASCALTERGRNAPSYDAVRALLSEGLAASIVEDKDGANALERAILSEASNDVVTLLQKASVETLREREGRGSTSKRRRVTGDAFDVAASAGSYPMFSAKRTRGARIDARGRSAAI